MSKPLDLAWRKFFRTMTIPAFGLALITIASWPPDLSIVMLWVLFASCTAFFALGWKRLRQENSARPFVASDVGRARKVLFGTPWVAIIWLVGTLAVVLSLTIGLTLHAAAA